jgi:hypothetical protein
LGGARVIREVSDHADSMECEKGLRGKGPMLFCARSKASNRLLERVDPSFVQGKLLEPIVGRIGRHQIDPPDLDLSGRESRPSFMGLRRMAGRRTVSGA